MTFRSRCVNITSVQPVAVTVAAAIAETKAKMAKKRENVFEHPKAASYAQRCPEVTKLLEKELLEGKL